MSAKNLDKHNRWRNKTVAFRVSPEEDAQIETAVKLTGLTIHDNMGIIATVGRGMVHNPGTAARLFTALSRYHINVRMIDQGSSELSILVGVDSGEFQQAILAIYDEFVSE